MTWRKICIYTTRAKKSSLDEAKINFMISTALLIWHYEWESGRPTLAKCLLLKIEYRPNTLPKGAPNINPPNTCCRWKRAVTLFWQHNQAYWQKIQLNLHMRKHALVAYYVRVCDKAIYLKWCLNLALICISCGGIWVKYNQFAASWFAQLLLWGNPPSWRRHSTCCHAIYASYANRWIFALAFYTC